MSDAYDRVKGGRLTFKGGNIASRSKTIDKNKHKKKKKKRDKNPNDDEIDPSNLDAEAEAEAGAGAGGDDTGTAGGEVYTIDAAKRMKYEELFPVETKKFGYQSKSNFKSVEEALDDRVKKKADRYCK